MLLITILVKKKGNMMPLLLKTSYKVNMLETDKLGEKMKNLINSVLPDLNLNKINFSVGTDNSPEGIYIFTQNGKYHYVYTEKGKIRTHKELENEDEILWNILETVIFDVAMDYAIKNKVQGKDFRRALFAKEVELYSKFGDDFEKRKNKEINAILEKNPYYDR